MLKTSPQSRIAEKKSRGGLRPGINRGATPERLRHLIVMIGDDRSELARLLGLTSEKLRQCETGEVALPAAKVAWLKQYAKIRARQNAAREAWLDRHPPPANAFMRRT